MPFPLTGSSPPKPDDTTWLSVIDLMIWTVQRTLCSEPIRPKLPVGYSTPRLVGPARNANMTSSL